MIQRFGRAAVAVPVGLFRSTAFAACALIIPACVAVLPTLAALNVWGSPWSVTNPWTWLALAIIATAATLALAHPVAFFFRALLGRWTGIRIATGFRQRPEPIRLSTGFWWNGSSYERTRKDAEADLRLQRLKEPAYWREVRWAIIAAVAVALPCVLPAAALIIGIIMIIHGATTVMIIIAVLLLAAAVATAPLMWRTVRPLASRFLSAPASTSPTAGELRHQRADLTASHDAEIRRIERDLHDGPQARMVAVGLDLAVAERLLRTDPDRAEQLIRSARTGTSTSLQDLRELVHGVYPPVLIERGLVPAIREQALSSPIAVEVDGPDLDLPSPLAAALYFSVCELLANVAKHAHATRAAVSIAETEGRVDVAVTDNGSGGATMRTGGGLDGVRRRLAAFDATLEISSPDHGATKITVKVPCE